MTLRLEPIARIEIGRAAWDTFVESSDEAWLWHRFDLAGALSTWRGWTDLSFALYEPGKKKRIVAVVPCHQIASQKGKALKINALDSLGGPACRKGLDPGLRQRVLDQACQHLITLAREHGSGEIAVALPPMAPALQGDNCPRVNPLLELGFTNALTQTWVIDLRAGKDALWKKMQGRARTAVRKAEKSGVSIRPADRRGDLDIYYLMHCETYNRTGVSPHPRAYFEAIWRDFLGTGLARIWFAEHGGKVVAAENFGVYKNAANYWTGASLSEGLAVEANSALQWAAIQWMADAGLEWYETGEAFPQAGKGKAKGLSDFKKSFGGELYPVYRGTIDMKSFTYKAFNIVRTIVR